MAITGPGNQMITLLAKARADDDFRKRFLAEPAEVLQAEGINLPAKVKVKVLENTADLIHIVLPAKQEALADEALGKVAAGNVPITIEIGDAPPGLYLPKDKVRCRNINCPKEIGSTECAQTFMITQGLCIMGIISG